MLTSVHDILICDDHPICQLGVECRLVQSLTGPFQVRTVNSLKSLIEALDLKKTDLLFLDLHLPDAHALESVVAVIQRYPEIPVIVVTSCQDRGPLERLRDWVQAGKLKALLWKTHDFERFQRALSAALTPATHFIDPDILKSLENFRPERLTPREWEVLELIAKGLTNDSIAKALNCSVETVKTHRSNLGYKTSSRTRSELTAWYLNRNGVGNLGPSA